MFKPTAQFATVVRVQHRVATDVNGAPDVSYIDADPALDYCNWKSRGGTESTESGTLSVEDTAEVMLWFREDLNQQDRLLLHDKTELAYDIIGPPENIEMRNMWLLLKVRRAVNA
ncbi:head-tail adaptor protein [Paenibacillus sp. HJGM_3]|uniref:head-tail adaptor protein n=1 Tax=Paenibacillus sp. HJGM_3 TaxID=3379816 RepID=UPI00385A2A68